MRAVREGRSGFQSQPVSRAVAGRMAWAAGSGRRRASLTFPGPAVVTARASRAGSVARARGCFLEPSCKKRRGCPARAVRAAVIWGAPESDKWGGTVFCWREPSQSRSGRSGTGLSAAAAGWTEMPSFWRCSAVGKFGVRLKANGPVAVAGWMAGRAGGGCGAWTGAVRAGTARPRRLFFMPVHPGGPDGQGMGTKRAVAFGLEAGAQIVHVAAAADQQAGGQVLAGVAHPAGETGAIKGRLPAPPRRHKGRGPVSFPAIRPSP